ncbi:precorrin-3B C(17)-methyltransferase [Allokutzneria multivorans]|uniref:Precorrin-3B C(17)-methyltransferase n=1 Tax=Allokutzneria multivorans TaxID=1142134 RepID=A0ABP7TIE3_9PSEU
MIGLFAVTAQGRRSAGELAAHLGADAAVVEGAVKPALRRMWPRLGAAVFFLSTGATVRMVAPLLTDRHGDPAVVCVDEESGFAVALTGGPAANALADRVAEFLGCRPVVTTAAESVGATVLDELVELLEATVDGELADCAAALLAGEPVRVVNPLRFPLPAMPSNVTVHEEPPPSGPQWTVVVDDRLLSVEGKVLRLVPRTLVIGIGSSIGVSAGAVTGLLAELAERAELDLRAVRAFATVDAKSDEPGIVDAVDDHGFWQDSAPDLLHYPAETLAGVDVPTPSEDVRAEMGTPSVAEAAALHAAGELACGSPVELVAAKLKGDKATVAAARVRPRGRLVIVDAGPDAEDLRVPRAEAELRRAAVVVGLEADLERVRHLLRQGTEVRVSVPGDERQRAAEAVRLAVAGLSVALVGSGALIGPALEQADARIEIAGVPGVSPESAAAAALGAPLGADHAVISLADSATPWPVIEQRVRAVAEADVVVCLRDNADWRLGAALDLLRLHRPPRTPVGVVGPGAGAGSGAEVAMITGFDPAAVPASATVVVGSSRTRAVGGRMVTPPASAH